MSALENGGPAFPRTGDTDPRMADYDQSDWHSGMSLRDWFAGQAISPMLVQAYGTTPLILAQKAYEMADALLAERSKP